MYRLLIVDDEYEIRTGLANYFPWDTVGFEIAGLCSNGVEALSFIEKQPVHAILCDVKMPVMDGLTFAQTLREKDSSVKLVFLSGYKDFEYVRKALQCNAQDYILKPTQFQEITRVFKKLQHELDLTHMPALTPEHTPDDLILAIQKIIQEQIDCVTLESVSREVFLSPFYVSKLFKQRTGKNFADYVTECRMKKAAELLCGHSCHTYEISMMVGYSNPNNFTRAFKKFYGVTPSEFKNVDRMKEVCKNHDITL